MQSITIPNLVTQIGKFSLLNCSSLQSIVVERDNLKYDSRENSNAIIETASNKLIAGCQNTVIPNSVAEIEESAFEDCSSLQSIAIPNSITKIGWNAFNGCNNLLSIVIPDSITEVRSWTFGYCRSLQSIIIPDSVTKIERNAFYDCCSLQSIVVDKNNPKYDSRNGCNAIIETASNKLIVGCSNTAIPNSVMVIDEDAFRHCFSLQSIAIPDSVTKIEPGAFSDCSNLKSIIIPNSVSTIGWGSFSGCSSLQSIIVDKNNPRYDCRSNCNAIIETASNILVAGCKNTVIPDSVTKIEGWTFEGCSGLRFIAIPDLVTEIGDYAFSGCRSLQSIIIPDSVLTIGNGTFCDCISLQSIVIPNSVSTIGRTAFSGCNSLQSIVIPDSVTKIGNRSFSSCSSLETIIIPDSVRWIGKSAFFGCSSLQSIKIKNPKLLEGTGVDLRKVEIITDENESGNVAENNGLLPGLFSVRPGRHVCFTKGNLQYQASTGLWRFAERQYDIVGLDNSKIHPSSYEGWIDLFGWSTPATTFGVATSRNYDDYTGEFRDWGQNNIGGNAVGSFRTLSKDEWEYLLSKRADAKNKYATGCIQLADDKYVCGCFFLPDTWTQPDGCSFNPGVSNQSDVVYSKNTYSLAQWAAMEQAGAIFLPAAGYRRGTSVEGVDPVGYGSYWSATNNYTKCAWGISAYDSIVTMKFLYRGDGRSVRLVQDIKK